jgi:hypothetical protein
VPVQPKTTKIEGSPYLYKAVYPSGETRYLARVSRAGKNIKRYFPFTEKGKSDALSEIDTFLKNLDPEDLKKADAVIKQRKDGKWTYTRPNKPVEVFNTEAEAKAFRKDAVKTKIEGQTKIPKGDFEKIKNKIIKGDTLEEIATDYKSSTRPIAKLLRDNNTTYSQLTPNTSYIKDSELRKLLKDNYGKLSRTSLAKTLFPDLDVKTADARVGNIIQDMRKSGELKVLGKGEFAEEVTEKFSTDPKNIKAQKISKRRRKKLNVLDSQAYESHLQTWKRNFQKFLGLPLVKGKFNPIDLAHRSDFDQLKALGVKLNPSDLGPDFYRSNREGIRKFKTGVKTLERKLKPLYTTQKNLFNQASKFDLDKIPESLKLKIDKNNTAITELVGDGIGGRIKPITINVDTLEVLRGDQNVTKTLGMGIIDKNMGEIQFPNRSNNFVGSEDDAIIKLNLAEQIKKEAVGHNLIDSKKADGLTKLFFLKDQYSNSPDGSVLRKNLDAEFKCADGCFIKVANKNPERIINKIQSNPEKIKSLIQTTGVTTADQIPQPAKSILRDEFKETNLRWNNDVGAFVDTKTDNIASQAELKTWADDNPMEVKVGEAKPGILRKTGKALAHIGLPLPTAAMDAYFIGRQIEEGKSPTEIAKDPFNWLGLATMDPLTRAAGMADKPGKLASVMRLGMSPGLIRGASRFLGLPGLALSTGLTAYDQYQKYKNKEGFIYDLFNREEIDNAQV